MNKIIEITHFRNYNISNESNIFTIICKAIFIILAATIFFNPIYIKVCKFINSGLNINNPINKVEGKTLNIWCLKIGDLKSLIKYFIFIKTGNPKKKQLRII